MGERYDMWLRDGRLECEEGWSARGELTAKRREAEMIGDKKKWRMEEENERM